MLDNSKQLTTLTHSVLRRMYFKTRRMKYQFWRVKRKRLAKRRPSFLYYKHKFDKSFISNKRSVRKHYGRVMGRYYRQWWRKVRRKIKKQVGSYQPAFFFKRRLFFLYHRYRYQLKNFSHIRRMPRFYFFFNPNLRFLPYCRRIQITRHWPRSVGNLPQGVFKYRSIYPSFSLVGHHGLKRIRVRRFRFGKRVSLFKALSDEVSTVRNIPSKKKRRGFSKMFQLRYGLHFRFWKQYWRKRKRRLWKRKNLKRMLQQRAKWRISQNRRRRLNKKKTSTKFDRLRKDASLNFFKRRPLLIPVRRDTNWWYSRSTPFMSWNSRFLRTRASIIRRLYGRASFKKFFLVHWPYIYRLLPNFLRKFLNHQDLSNNFWSLHRQKKQKKRRLRFGAVGLDFKQVLFLPFLKNFSSRTIRTMPITHFNLQLGYTSVVKSTLLQNGAGFLRSFLIPRGRKAYKNEVMLSCLTILKLVVKQPVSKILKYLFWRIMPLVKFLPKTFGRTRFKVPVKTRPPVSLYLAIFKLVQFSRLRAEETPGLRIAAECLETLLGSSKTLKWKQDIHAQAFENRDKLMYLRNM